MYSWDWRQLGWMNYYGWWPDLIKNKPIQTICRIYGYLTGLFYTISVSVDVYGLYYMINQSEFDLVIFTLSGIMRGTLCLSKFYTCFFKNKQLEEIISNINEMSQVVSTRCDEKSKQELLKRRQRCIWSTYIISFSLMTLFLWILNCLIEAIFHGKKTLVIISYCPININTWENWFIAVLWQSIYNLIGSFIFAIMDSIYGSIAELILGHFQILKSDLEKNSFTQKREINECIIYHQKLMRTCLLFKEVSLVSVFFHCTVSTLIICLSIFELTFINATSSLLIANAVTLYLMVVEIFIYCWYCNEISTQSEEIGTSCYLNNWYDGDKKDNMSLINIMIRTRQPIVFGGILKTNLETFINILRAAFSYYSFLKVIGGYEK